MATYNGARFLKAQLESILRQLGPGDELIVVDDQSGDSSREIVESFQDARLSLYINDRNLGPVRTFERALTLSSGDVVFFSDQDDLWLEGKVAVCAQALKDSGKAAVVSDAKVVDEDG